jgi:hypothetical protein
MFLEEGLLTLFLGTATLFVTMFSVFTHDLQSKILCQGNFHKNDTTRSRHSISASFRDLFGAHPALAAHSGD